MRLVIVGPAEWWDHGVVDEAIAEHAQEPSPVVPVVVHTGSGPGRRAAEVAEAWGWGVQHVPLDVMRHGNKAIARRGDAMLAKEPGERVVALVFLAGPDRTTEDMLGRARAAGVPVRVYRPKTANPNAPRLAVPR